MDVNSSGEQLQVTVTADPFGYGPASKAETVSRFLQRSPTDLSVHYHAKDTALDFGELNSEVFDSITDADEVGIEEHVERADIDLLLSVMEPRPVIVAHQHDVPTVVVDSLFWFWEWSDPVEIIDRIREIQPDTDGVRSYFEELTGNDLDLAAHTVADKSFLQRYPGVTQIDETTTRVGDVTEVNPIVDTSPRDSDTERDRIVVTFGGQLSPAVGREGAVRQAESVLRLLEPKLESFRADGFEPIVAGHPEVVENLSTEYEAAALDHEEMLSTLNRAAGLLSPPSITAVYEAIMYRVPIFFLPEQQPGHWPEFERVHSAGDDDTFFGIVLGEEYEAVRDMTIQDQDKKQGFDQVAADAREIRDIVTRISEWSEADVRDAFPAYERLEQFADADSRAAIAARQREAILDDSAVVSGGAQIAESVLDTYGRPHQ